MASHRLCLVHPHDPRVETDGLVENRLQAVLTSLPPDFSVVVVGVDRRGDLRTGEPVSVGVGGGTVDFLPVMRHGRGSFAAAVMRHLPAVRAAARAEVASTSVHDLTWVPLARLVGRPVVLVVHRDPREGAVAGRVSLTAALRETVALRVADRIVGCDAAFVRRCRDGHPVIAAKTEILALPTAEEARVFSLFDEDQQIGRLWERHRRLFDAHPVHRGRHVAA